MEPSIKIPFLTLLLLACTSFSFSKSGANKSPFKDVEWIKRAEVNLSDLAEAGGSETTPYYIARIKPTAQSPYVPGWFNVHPSQGEKGCTAFNGSNYCFRYGEGDFELLAYSNEIVEWIPAQGHFPITPNIVYGGIDPEFNEEVFICRAINTNVTSLMLPGKYVPSKGLCVYESYGERLAHRFEILALNDQGNFYQAGNGRSCETIAPARTASTSTLEWINRGDVIISDLEAGGWQIGITGGDPNFNYTVYVARGQIVKDNTFTSIPGKFYIHPGNGGDSYGFGYDGYYIRPNFIELLVHPPMSVTWIPGRGHHIITPYNIYGGVDPEQMEEVFVCRAYHRRFVNVTYLVPGKYVPSSGHCAVAADGLEYLYDKYEMLVLNNDGISLGLRNGRRC